jgi:hypothetical protein
LGFADVQAAGVPANWINSTVVPANGGGGGSSLSATGRRLQQQNPNDVTVSL